MTRNPLARRELLTLTGTALAVGLAGCGGGGGGSAGDSTTTEAATTVEMANTSFAPLRASVDPGTTVEWVNQDAFGHDVVSATFHDAATAWEFESDTLGEGGTTGHTFEEEGIYEYYCSIHGQSNMCGVVLVGDVSLDAQLPCEG